MPSLIDVDQDVTLSSKKNQVRSSIVSRKPGAHDRDSKEYAELMNDVSGILNQLPKAKVRALQVNTDELVDEISHLIHFKLQVDQQRDDEAEYELSIDIEWVPRSLRVQYWVKLLPLLKGISNRLRPDHRRTLARIHRMSGYTRKFKFDTYDLNASMKRYRDNIHRHFNNVEMVSDGWQQMDILNKAMSDATKARMELEEISRSLEDENHPNHEKARVWQAGTPWKSLSAFLAKVDDNKRMMEEKAKEALEKMSEISGIQFQVNFDDLEPEYKWYVLGNDLPRGMDFVKSFQLTEFLGKRIKPYTVPMVKSQWDAEPLEHAVEKARPVKVSVQLDISRLSELFLEIRELIDEGLRWNGILETALEWKHPSNLVSDVERRQMRVWAEDNMIRLAKLLVRTYRTLKNYHQKNPKLVFYEQFNELVDRRIETPHISKAHLIELDKKLDKIEAFSARGASEADTLEQLVRLHRDANKTLAVLQDVLFFDRLYDESDPKAFEGNCTTCFKLIRMLQAFMKRIETLMVNIYRKGQFGIKDSNGKPEKSEHLDYLTRDIFEDVFKVYQEYVFSHLRQLDYSYTTAHHFEDTFKNIKALKPDVALPGLERLFLEMHRLPAEDVLIEQMRSLGNLGHKADALEARIVTNSGDLQRLTNKIQTYLRQILTQTQGHSRRLRFEVFSLADCHAGNLDELVKRIMEQVATMSSAEEGERIFEFLAEIEKKVIEAQEQTNENSETYARLAAMADKTLPGKLTAQLRDDLLQNYEDLDALLNYINQAQREVRLKQIAFGQKVDIGHLSQVVNFEDKQTLTRHYDFVDHRNHDDLKRFAKAYKERVSTMENVLSKGSRNNTDIPLAVASVITPGMVKEYKQSMRIDPKVKTLIFQRIPPCLETEANFLSQVLNFVKSDSVRDRMVYKSLLEVLGRAKDMNLEEKRELRKLWVAIRGHLELYQPARFEENYQNNLTALKTDVENTAGHHFVI